MSSELTAGRIFGEDCKAVAAEFVRQPELLAGVFLEKEEILTPEETARVERVKRYTGARSTTDEQRALTIGALRLLGASDREIARACGVTRRTIPVVMRELERAGRVTPLKERLVELVADNAERSGILVRELMERGLAGEKGQDLAAMIRAAGTVNDFQIKSLQLLTGQATERRETVIAAGRAEVEDWLKSCAIPIDSASTGSTQIPAESGGFAPSVTAQLRQESPTAGWTSGTGRPDQAEPAGGEPAGGGSAGGGGGQDKMD